MRAHACVHAPVERRLRLPSVLRVCSGASGCADWRGRRGGASFRARPCSACVCTHPRLLRLLQACTILMTILGHPLDTAPLFDRTHAYFVRSHADMRHPLAAPHLEHTPALPTIAASRCSSSSSGVACQPWRVHMHTASRKGGVHVCVFRPVNAAVHIARMVVACMCGGAVRLARAVRFGLRCAARGASVCLPLGL